MSEHPAQLERILAAYIGRQIAGEAEPVAEFLAGHPEHSAALRRRLRLLEVVGVLDREVAEPATRRRFDHYEILGGPISGGMGVVYRGRDVRLQREVAIKFLRDADKWRPAMRERFERETMVLAGLHHPSVVPVFGSGEAEGSPYIVMAWIEGSSLADTVARLEQPNAHTATTTRATLQVGAKVARALHELHGRGVVHRDVKPANILIDGRGEPILVDFGLAQTSDLDRLTMTGEFVGTLAYMAPEQALGRDIDGRADVFGLGASLFHLLTGRPPIDVGSPASYLARIQAGIGLDSLGHARGLPKDLAAVLEHALEIEPRHRYATCGDFADDLEAILEGRPVRVVRTGPLTRGFRFLHRRPSVAAVLALLLVLVVVGASWGRDAYAQHLVDSELAYARNNAEAHSQYALGDLQEADRVLDLVLKEYPERLFPRVLHVLSGCSSDSPGSHKTLHRDPKRLARARLRFAPIEQRTDDSLALGVLAAYLSGAEPPEDRAIRREHRSAEDLAAWVAVMHFLGRDVEIARRLTAIQKLGADHLIQIAMTVVKDDELDGFALSAGHAALALLETPVTLQVLGLRYVEIGERSGRVGDFELGLSLLRRAQLKQPENWRLKHNLGYGLAQTAGFRKLPDDCDERRQAERLYREVLSVRPENAPTLFNLANLLLDRKPRHHSEEALRLYERVEGTHGDRIGYWRSRLWSTKYLRGVSDAAKLAGVALQRTKTGAGYAELLLDRVQFMSEAKASIQEIRKAVGLVLPYLNQRDGARVDEFFVAVAATRDSELVVDIWREFIRKVPLPLWTIVERFHKDHGVPLPPRGFKKR